MLNPGSLHLGDGFALFCPQALAMRRFGYDRVAHAKSFDEIIAMWQPEKVVRLTDTDAQAKWRRPTIAPGKRYALWGAGLSGGFIADELQASGAQLAFVVDVDAAKHGKPFYGATIYAPEYLAAHVDAYDFLVIGHYTRFQEIKQDALRMGVPGDRIVLPYEI